MEPQSCKFLEYIYFILKLIIKSFGLGGSSQILKQNTDGTRVRLVETKFLFGLETVALNY